MKSIFITTLLLSVFLLPLPSANACSCIDPPAPRDELKKAKAVFVGEVIEVNEFIDDQYRYKVKFRVERYWKGIKRPEITILTNMPVGDCGLLSFEAGKKYLVYAFERKLIADGCRRNKSLRYASEDLKELGEGKRFS